MSHTVLLPFELPDADPVAPVLAETLSAMEAVALGHYALPEQTPPSAGRAQFEADASAELDTLTRPLTDAGVPVRTRLVFGTSREKAVDRVAVDEGCDVILVPGAADAVSRVAVPLRGGDNAGRIVSFVADLLTATDATVTLFHAGQASDRRPGAELLADARDRLVDAGVTPDRIATRLDGGSDGADGGRGGGGGDTGSGVGGGSGDAGGGVGGGSGDAGGDVGGGSGDATGDADVGDSLVDLAAAFDLLVLGETEPSLRNRILGTLPAQVTADVDTPAFVVRDADVDGDDTDTEADTDANVGGT